MTPFLGNVKYLIEVAVWLELSPKVAGQRKFSRHGSLAPQEKRPQSTNELWPLNLRFRLGALGAKGDQDLVCALEGLTRLEFADTSEVRHAVDR